MVDGRVEYGRLVRVGNAWVAMVVRAEDSSIRIRLLGGGTRIAAGTPEDIMIVLGTEQETMH